MSTSNELRRIVGAMTARPWKHGSWQYETEPKFHYTEIRPSGDEDVSITVDGPVPNNPLDAQNVIGGCGCCDSPFGRAADGQAITALANHADALVKLLEACEQWSDAHSIEYDMHSQEARRAAMKTRSDANMALADAIAAVHAVNSVT